MEDNLYLASEVAKLPQGIVGYTLGELEDLVHIVSRGGFGNDLTLVRLVDESGTVWLRVLYALPKSLQNEVVRVKFYINAEQQAIVDDSSCIEVLQTVTSDDKPQTETKRVPLLCDITQAKMHVGDFVQISGFTSSKILAGKEYSTQLSKDNDKITVLVAFAKSFDDFETGDVVLNGIITKDGKLLVEHTEDWLVAKDIKSERTEDPADSITKRDALALPFETEVTICGWCQNDIRGDTDVLSIKDTNDEYLMVKIANAPWPYVCKGDRVAVTGKLEQCTDSTGQLWYKLVASDKNAIKFLYLATSDKKKTTTTTVTTTPKNNYGAKCHTGNVLVYKHASGAGLYLGGWTREAWPENNWAVIDLTGNKDLKSGEISADDTKSASAFSNVLAAEVNDHIVLRLPIRDMGVPAFKRETWQALVTDILKLLEAGTSVLICCTGGHGRTGLAGAIILGLLTDNTEIKADPITWLRKNYCDEIVETIAQAQYVWNILKLSGKPPEPATKYYQGANHQNWQQGKLTNTNSDPKVGTRRNTTATVRNSGVSGKKKSTKVSTVCDGCRSIINDNAERFNIADFVLCRYCKESNIGECCFCSETEDVILAAPGHIKNFSTFMDKVELYYCEKHLPMPAYSICVECGCAVSLKKWLSDPVCVDCWKKTNEQAVN